MWKNSRKETELIKSCMINQILKKIIEQQKSAHSRLISLYFSKCAGWGRTVTGETLYIIKKSNKSTKWALFNPSPLLGNPCSSFLNWVVSVTFQNKVTEVSESEEGHQSKSLWEWRTVWRTNRISDEYSHTTMILNLFSVLLKQIKINKQTSHCYLINHWIIKGSKLNFSSVKASAVASANACFVYLKSSINPFIILSTYPKSGCDGSILSRVFQATFSPASLSSSSWEIWRHPQVRQDM